MSSPGDAQTAKFWKVLRYDEAAVVSMLATLLAQPYGQQIDTLAVMTRAFIEKRDAS